MARDLFTDVASTRSRDSRQWYTVPLSMLAHTALLLMLVIVPLLAGDVLPSPTTLLAFVAVAPPPVPDVPPPPTPRRAAAPVEPETFDAAPTEAPSRIAEEVLQPTAPVVNLGLPSPPSQPGAPTVRELAPAPPPPPAIDKPLPVGGNIQAPVKIRDAKPVYPAVARAARIEGMVIVEATIAKDGRVVDARVLRSIPLLDEAALAAVREWRYSTPTLNGVPIDVLMTVTIRFALN